MNVVTQNGYNLFEVVSALQKEIRRGEEESAMYWALELVPQFEDYLWQRLVVITNEDVGIANPNLLQIIPTQRAVYFEFRSAKKDGSARLALANAILLLCRSPKCRVADHFQCAVNQDRLHGKRREIPDYALDKHTQRGRKMGRGVEHWLADGCQLHPQSDVHDPYVERAAAWWTGEEFVQTDYTNGKRRAARTGSAPSQLEFDLE